MLLAGRDDSASAEGGAGMRGRTGRGCTAAILIVVLMVLADRDENGSALGGAGVIGRTGRGCTAAILIGGAY